MRKIVLLFSALCFIIVLKAQPTDKKVSKVTFEMVDGKYQDAAFKAEKLLDDSEYRKNAWLWYYLTQSYFEIAKRAEFSEEYPRAFKEALKAAYKLNKYKDDSDENMEVYQEAKEYLATLKDSAITLSEIYYDNDNPRKAAYYLKKIIKFDPDDYAVQLMAGVYQIKSRNIGEGIKNMVAAIDSLDESYVPDEVSAQTLVDGLDEYALIIKSGEYDKYFNAYKFEPTEADVQNALAMKEGFKKYIIGKEVNKEERKKESETIYKSFRSEDLEDDDDE
jgi:tetratricopeptide (TPR) repeat protein